MADDAGDRDARDAERHAILGELRGDVMVLQPLVVREISHAGAQIETRFPLQIEFTARVPLDARRPPARPPRPRRSLPNRRYGSGSGPVFLGLQFVALS